MHLRTKRLGGLKFRRQQPIGAYIVDFVCFERRIVIEVDGGGHAFAKAKDNARDAWLQGQGFQVLRFWNNDVLQNIDGVLAVIREYTFNHPPSVT
jgi:very-short-patch-repair endonuclease